DGSYSFLPEQRWPFPPRVRLSVDGMLIEVARRADEEKRYSQALPDPTARLTVCDLPDPDEPLTDEERELFGIMDGRHTAAQVRDLRFALELYRREQGRYPERLAELLESRTLDAPGMRVPGYDVRYRPQRNGAEYSLELDPQR